MEKELIFQILGISVTKDEEEIRKAYREVLKDTNPEDDPEGFKRLRQAYEEALRLVSEPENEEEEEQLKDEVDIWIDQVDALYQDIFSRHKIDPWKEILADPVCEGLDTSLEAREKIIVYLMNHIHLPHEVWKLIDTVFEITADIDSLKEKYPVNFLNYMKYYVENATFIPFHLFTHVNCDNESEEENINGDGYIDEYLRIKKQIDNGQTEGCYQSLDDLKAFSIYHPYEDVERIRILTAEKRTEEGYALARNLLEQYGDDTYIQLHAGKALYEAGRKEEAYELWKAILDKWPDHYLAKYFSMKYLVDKEDYFNARELILDLLEVNDGDEELVTCIKKVNEALIQEFTSTLERGEEDPRLPGNELKLRLGRCLFQNERLEEAVKVVESFQPEPELECKYMNLCAQLFYRMEDYQKASHYLHKWLEQIEKLTDDGTEETRRQMSRESLAHVLLSCCLYELDLPQEGEKEAEKAIETSLNEQERIKNMHYYANRLRLSKKSERAVDICDEIIEADAGYYPAYLIRQEAYYDLRRAQQVVDDYHRAVDIYPGFYRPYLLAVKVFFNYGQYEDAKKVIDRAKENEVEFSADMTLWEAKVLRSMSHGAGDRKAPKQMLETLAGELDSENCDIEDKSEVVYERGLLCWDDDEFEQALAFLEEAIRQNPQRMQYRMTRGNVYLELKRYKEALEEYQAGSDAYKNAPELYYNRGCAYEGLENINQAVEEYKKALELNDRYRNTNDKLYSIYRKRYNRNNRKADYEQALYYINKQLEIRETSSAYFHRAVLYDDAMETELSLKDYEKSLEYEPDDYVAYSNMGFCYRAVRQFEKALECFKKARELMKKRDANTRPYYQSGMCYKALHRYDEALKCFQEGAEIFPEDSDFMEQIGHIYQRQKKYEKALESFDKMKGLSDDMYNDKAWVWIEKGNPEKGYKVLKEGIKKVREDKKPKLYSDLGDCYYDMMDYKKAVDCYLKAIYLEQDPRELFGYEENLARAYYMAGNHKKAAKYAGDALEHLRKSGRTEEDYVGYTAYGPARIGAIGWLYLCLGDKEKAVEYFQKMEEIQPCRYCEFEKCYESTLWLGRFYESQGDYESAARLIEETVRRHPHSVEAQQALKNIRRKL